MKEYTLYFDDSTKWRKWLEENHSNNIIVWLVFYKKEAGKTTLKYEEAVNEALCFGWIDSIIKKIDEERYVRKFTKRNNNSKWSELNKKRVEKLIKTKRMTAAGLSKIEFAKKNGLWSKINRPEISYVVPSEFQSELNKHKKAKAYFDKLGSTYQKQYIGWINTAKLNSTKIKRIKESIHLLKEGKKLGLK